MRIRALYFLLLSIAASARASRAFRCAGTSATAQQRNLTAAARSISLRRSLAVPAKARQHNRHVQPLQGVTVADLTVLALHPLGSDDLVEVPGQHEVDTSAFEGGGAAVGVVDEQMTFASRTRPITFS